MPYWSFITRFASLGLFPNSTTHLGIDLAGTPNLAARLFFVLFLIPLPLPGAFLRHLGFSQSEMSHPPPRRSSLGMLLRRSKSGDMRKQQAREQELQRQRDAAVSKSPPRLPQLYNGAPPTHLFGGDVRPDPQPVGPSARQSSSPSRPSMDPAYSVVSVPPPIPTGAWVDPYARTESMTHRGRYSYASSAISTINSPRRVRRRKDPTPFK